MSKVKGRSELVPLNGLEREAHCVNSILKYIIYCWQK